MSKSTENPEGQKSWRRYHQRFKTVKERFWEKVDKCGDDECWNWLGAKQYSGYGQIMISKINTKVHRFSWEFHFGEIPENMLVLHKCDNRACVNPRHLWLGTHTDNMQDMIQKDRCPRAKLTMENHKQIEHMYFDKNVSVITMCKMFNVSRSTIYHVINKASRK